jgi:3-phenylpropionate/trans-cinnamate dioxygenase ferredoxin reductase subunit
MTSSCSAASPSTTSTWPTRKSSPRVAVLIGGGLIGCEAAACIAGRGVPTTMVAAEPVPLQRRFGDRVGERVAKILSDNGVRFLGSTTVTAIDDTRVHLDTDATLDGDVALAYNVTAGKPIRAEHWRDAAQQGLIAGLSAAGQAAAWDKVPGFSCTIGESTLKYRGWGIGYEHSRFVEHHNGFTVWYESSGEVVGVLSLNADEDYRLADKLVRSHSPMTI